MTVGNETELWRLLRVRSNYEKKVSALFHQLGIVHLMPINKQLRQWKDRKKWVEVPTLPCYVFVYLKNSQRFKVFDVPGVLGYVSNQSQPIIVNENDIKIVKRLCTYDGEVDSIKDVSQIEVGREMLIKSGHFKGLKGEVLRHNHQYVILKIQSLNFFAKVNIGVQDLIG